VAALEAKRRKHVVEESSGLSHEWLAKAVLVRPGRFANQHPGRSLIADAEHRLLARAAQPAISAGGDALLERRPVERKNAALARLG
jgi:hypothetical protein